MKVKKIFRKKSLERLSTPDRLDGLLRVVKPHGWLAIMSVGIGIVLAVIWGFLGRIPVTVQGNAILVHPREVVPFQSLGAGRLVDWNVAVGDQVKKDQVLGTLALPEVEKQIQQAEAKLGEFNARAKILTGFEKEQATIERDQIKVLEKQIRKRIKTLTRISRETKEKTDKYNQTQKDKIGATRIAFTKVQKELRGRVDRYKNLLRKGASTIDVIIDIERSLIEHENRLAQLEVQEREIDLVAIRAEESNAQRLDKIAELEMRLQELELRRFEIERRLKEDKETNKAQEAELKRELERLRHLKTTRGRIVAEHTGRLIEVNVLAGVLVQAGQRLGSMAVEHPDRPLQGLIYFQNKDGKKIKEGMRVRVSPATVQKALHGSMRGTVDTVSTFPVTTESAANKIGIAEVAQQLTAGGYQIEVQVTLETDPSTTSGYKWTSSKGPDDTITAGTNASARVTVKEQRPVVLALPFLKEWLGVN